MKVSPGTRYGFTLLEVMIAVAIAGIVSGGLFTVFNTSLNYWSRISKRSELSLYGKIAIDRVSMDFRAGENVVDRYFVQDNTLYKASQDENIPLVNNVSQFRIMENNRFITILLNLQTEDTTVNYRTGVTRRINMENE